MSWFTGIAGRAEALLDKMDQAAATSIQSTGLATPLRRSAAPQTASLAYEPTASTTAAAPSKGPALATHKPYSPVSRPEAPPQTTPTPSSYNAYSKSRAIVANDDTIFQFLNTPSKQPQPRRPQAKTTLSNPPIVQPNRDVVDQRTEVAPATVVDREVDEREKPSLSEREEKESEKESEGEREKRDEVGKREESQGEGGHSDSDNGSGDEAETDGPHEVVSGPQDELEAGSSERPPSPVGHGAARGEEEIGEVAVVQQQPMVGDGGMTVEQLEQQMAGLQRKVSDLQLENRLLKREVTSLNDELGTVLERVREAEEGVATHRKEAESLQEQVVASERVIRQLRSHDDDVQAALQARDSQIQVLRKELLEAEQREESLRVRLEEEGKEKERLLQDASRSSEATSHAMEVVRSQLQQTQEELTQERETNLRAKREFSERERSLQSQQKQLSDTVESQLRQLNLLQTKLAEGQRSVQAANRELAQANREHEEYKKRAAGILQTGITDHIQPMTSVLPVTSHTYHDSRLHNVRRAMNNLDSASVRFAVFLRRYPTARLFLILYMVLLHFWVLLVLLTYTPETHGPSDLLTPHEP